MKRFTILSALLLLAGAGILPLAAAEEPSLGPPPENHVLDRDRLFRVRPEVLKEISDRLVTLEKEYDMDVYLVIYTSAIGENGTDLAYAYQKQWLGEKSDGLVFLASGSGRSNGRVGRSRPLYDGAFTEEGLLPRVEFHDLQTMIDIASEKMQEAEGVVPRVRDLTLSMVDQLEETLATQKQDLPRRENNAFMGWMALLLIGIGLAIALLSKILGAKEERVGRSYFFPDLAMKSRLKARNGGGKVTCLDFGPGFSDDAP